MNSNQKSVRFNNSSVSGRMRSILLNILLLLLTFISLNSYANTRQKPIKIREQGSFAVGGTVITNPGTFNPYNQTPEGQTFHGDHAYVFYQIPVKARKYPL